MRHPERLRRWRHRPDRHALFFVADQDRWRLAGGLTPDAPSSLIAVWLSNSAVTRLRAVPTLNLYFTLKLPEIPAETVGAFTDISQTWEGGAEFDDRTVLARLVAEPYGLPAQDRATTPSPCWSSSPSP